ncbi:MULTISPECIES: SGNH/GDSL hydrolase family protein [Streptomycetaceae]|uniref:Secreted protein n=1 Tax=Streptantibioticus cattleyicolor (strain ATCC 35852 / DSM 46488 / JCM 4925 / NBRC 14057 / NRRL 8057) TaxID=1003195 RepID=F8JTD2_STREN|nr:SGNH/GDSL hydrolase family protein [Streptantibioticus cattleyicolor]AEW94286.1 secreted protein [Streptantibioticus cattleyicolor NRRL 8057 = DSM 46488]MYS58942.1 SGNH/GDSL hydrolase family protein [Streptomyces sp. SID5468]CCB74642.1 putative secreted protein [Streptantibioticus cattleyicolor NRRL 8057 = DSM 46488]
MTRKSGYALLAALAAVVALVCTAIVVGVGGARTETSTDAEAPRPRASAAAPAIAGTWVGTWSAAAAATEPDTPHGYPDTSIRNVVHTSVGGTAARVQLSNVFGTVPVTFTHVTLGVADAPSSPRAVPDTLTTLAFGGRPAVTIPAGQSVVSDAVRLRVPTAADLLITTYSPTPAGPVTYHPHARQTSYLAHGDHAGDPSGAAFTERSPYWRYVTAVDVWTDDANGAVVALGDSITDGVTSTVDADHRWPDYLAQRLRTSPDGPRLGVLNAGISGNRILTDAAPSIAWNGPRALERAFRDALSRTGVKAMVVELGINDIIELPHRTDPDAIVAGLQQITREAHAHGVRVVGGTLMPFGGQRSWTPALERVRQRVNAAIRSGKVFDDVVDFDHALRDPRHPQRLLPAYDSGDHLHPTDAGYEAMADALSLPTLTGPAPAGV